MIKKISLVFLIILGTLTARSQILLNADSAKIKKDILSQGGILSRSIIEDAQRQSDGSLVDLHALVSSYNTAMGYSSTALPERGKSAFLLSTLPTSLDQEHRMAASDISFFHSLSRAMADFPMELTPELAEKWKSYRRHLHSGFFRLDDGPN